MSVALILQYNTHTTPIPQPHSQIGFCDAIVLSYYHTRELRAQRAMSRKEGSTEAQTTKRVAQATYALGAGLSRSSVVKAMAAEHEVTHRTARRWVQAAMCNHFDAPLSDTDLGFTVACAIERLERLQDESSAAGDRVTEIAACKAAASIAHQRLAARERIEAQGQRLRMDMSEFMSLGAPADIKTSNMPF